MSPVVGPTEHDPPAVPMRPEGIAFDNPQIAMADLPAAETVTHEALDPRYAVMVSTLSALFGTIGAGAAVTAASLAEDLEKTPTVLAALTALSVFLIVVVPWIRFKACKAIGYGVRQHDISLRRGLIWQSHTVQPIARIQHVELKRGPIEKRCGLAQLTLFSAGSGAATFSIPGLPLLRAARIRKYILNAHQR